MKWPRFCWLRLRRHEWSEWKPSWHWGDDSRLCLRCGTRRWRTSPERPLINIGRTPNGSRTKSTAGEQHYRFEQGGRP